MATLRALVGAVARTARRGLSGSFHSLRVPRPAPRYGARVVGSFSHLPCTILPGILQGIIPEEIMRETAQKRALRNYRSRLTKRGIARFEVLGLDADRDLIRSIARRLAEEGPDSARIRAAIGRTISGDPPKRGGILEALRRSPMVGADLEFERSRESGRKVDL
jgi:hypothetical protein